MHEHEPVQMIAPLFEISGTTSICDGETEHDAQSLQRLVKLQVMRLLLLGVGPADRVILYGPKTTDYCALLLGLFALGAIAVPVFHGLKPLHLEHVLKDCRPKIVFTPPHVDAQIKSLIVTEGSTWATITPIDNDAAPESPACITDMSPQLPAAIIYTSGSTGMPKGVVFSRENLSLGASSVAEFVKLGRSDSVLCVLPFSFDAGLMCLFSALVAGSRIVLANFVHSSQLRSLCQRWSVTSITAVPGLWTKIGEAGWQDTCHSVRTLCNTGGHLTQANMAMLSRNFPNSDIIPMYGFTEAFRCAYMPASRVSQKPGSVGRSIPHASFALVSAAGKLCKPGEIGELVQFGPLVTLGYWNQPNATADKFRNVGSQVLNKLKRPTGTHFQVDPDHLTKSVWSGDLARIDADGDLYFIGRNDDMIKVNGYRISPSEIESCCIKHGCTCAFAFPHRNTEEIALAYAGDIAPEVLRCGLAKVLPAYMIPSHWVPLTDLPINPNGKFDRAEIRKVAEQQLERLS